MQPIRLLRSLLPLILVIFVEVFVVNIVNVVIIVIFEIVVSVGHKCTRNDERKESTLTQCLSYHNKSEIAINLEQIFCKKVVIPPYRMSGVCQAVGSTAEKM